MRDPTVDDRVGVAIREARSNLEFFQRVGELDKGEKDRPLRLAARRYIRRLSDEDMPKHLREYVCRMLEDAKGRSTYLSRNMWVSFAVDETIQRGFAPTRNAASRGGRAGESACSIVATALGQLGVHLSERTVEDIWTNHIWTETRPEKSAR